MSVKMNLRIKTKNHPADPKIGFLTKSISKPNGRARAMPPAWELRFSYPDSVNVYYSMEKKKSVKKED